MTNDQDHRALFTMAREVTLTLLGVLALHNADPSLATGAARGLDDVFRGYLPGFPGADRTKRGRPAMRALLEAIDQHAAISNREGIPT